jgi:hypothetical protein
MVSGPQVRAASVSSCTTADTWMAETSVLEAQADDTARACATVAPIRQKAVTEAPNFIHVIQASWVCPLARDLNLIPGSGQAFGKRELSGFILGLRIRHHLVRVFMNMRRVWKISFAFSLLPALISLTAAPAWAFRMPEPNTPYPVPRQTESRYAEPPRQPYATSLADEAARRMGIEDGKWEAFSTHPSDPLTPSFRGGIDGGKAMIGLQWRFGS